MYRLSQERQVEIVSCLLEGMSLRAASRHTGAALNTVMSLQFRLGKACADYQDKIFRELTCKRLQCDEMWSFVYSKEKNATPALKAKHKAGDVWTWTAIDPDTKLIPYWYVGDRDYASAQIFMDNLASRIAGRLQLSTDGLKTYIEVVRESFGDEVDFGMLKKIYGTTPGDKREKYVGFTREVIIGNPDPEHIGTSYVERHNLTMRMHNRRLTRKTNAFSKKLECHKRAMDLYFMYYNFVRIHKTIRVTPAMEAGLSDHVWSLNEILDLMERYEGQLKAA